MISGTRERVKNGKGDKMRLRTGDCVCIKADQYPNGF